MEGQKRKREQDGVGRGRGGSVRWGREGQREREMELGGARFGDRA